MIGMFLQMWTEDRRARCFRAIAGLCVALWVVGSISVVYGSLAPQWTTPHCPQGQTHSGQQSHSHCVWHCDGIDTPSSSGRSWRPAITPTGFLHGDFTATIIGAAILQGGMAIRGPPQIPMS